jgi:hypothetical protein
MVSGSPATLNDICVHSNVTNNHDSTFTAEWITTVSDMYLVIVQLNGIQIRSSPLTFYASPGEVSLNSSKVLDLPKSHECGQSLLFFLELLDKFGNTLENENKVIFFWFFVFLCNHNKKPMI